MIKNLFFWVIPALFTLSISHAHAENPDWVLVATVNTSSLQVKQSSVTKIQNSLVFDGYTTLGAGIRSLDRYIVSCNGKLVASLSRVPFVSTESKDRLRWLKDRDTTILSSTTSLIIDAELNNEYWFMTQLFKAKIQSWCKGSPKGLKNIEASIASSGKNDVNVETHVLLLDSLRSFPKYREIWTATYAVNEKPILSIDPVTGESTQVWWDDKPQFEKSPIGEANSRTRLRFQCNEKKITLVQSVAYSKSGGVDSSQSLTETQINLNWAEVIPRSTGAALLEFVCTL